MSSMDWRNIIFEIILIIIGIFIYLPFFKVAEQNELRKQENIAE